MADGEQCPRCGKAPVLHGSFSTRGVRFGFRPEGLRLFSLSLQFPEVPVSSAAAACASCGLGWAEPDAATLRRPTAVDEHPDLIKSGDEAASSPPPEHNLVTDPRGTL